MPRVVNKSSRSYIIGGVTLLPHVPDDIDDKFMKNQRVQELLTEGNLEVCDEARGKTKAEMEASA